MSTEAPAAPAPAAAPAPTQAAPAAPQQAPAPFLGGESQQQQPAATQGQQQPASFFRDDYSTEGKFKEGWSQKFADLGYHRLAAKGALAKDEAGFLKMMDDTIGHASGRRITRPSEGASDQDVADFRSLVGAPTEASEYGFMKEGLPEGVTRDDLLSGKVEAALHKHHVSKEAAAELSGIYLEQLGAMKEKGNEAINKRIAELQESTTAELRKEFGEDYEATNTAIKDFLTARKVNLDDPLVRYALLHSPIAKIVNEARKASREAPLAGIKQEVFTGSGSPRQQAQEIMKQDRNWRNDSEKAARVADLYAQQAAIDKRRGGSK